MEAIDLKANLRDKVGKGLPDLLEKIILYQLLFMAIKKNQYQFL